MLHPLILRPLNLCDDLELVTSLRLEELEKDLGGMVRERAERDVFIVERPEYLVE